MFKSKKAASVSEALALLIEVQRDIFRNPMILKLGIQLWGLKVYLVYINDDPGLTLTYLTAGSNWGTYTFEWEKSVTKSFDGKILQPWTKLTE